MMNFNTGGIRLADDATAAQACVNHTTLKTTEPYLAVKNSLVYNNGPSGTTQITSALTSPACTAEEWYDMLHTSDSVNPARGSGGGPDPLIDPTYPSDPSSGQFVPPASGPLTGSGTDCKAFDPFFDTTNYIGAFAPGGANWLFPGPGSCWISFAQN
jgi:hypothetical protein